MALAYSYYPAKKQLDALAEDTAAAAAATSSFHAVVNISWAPERIRHCSQMTVLWQNGADDMACSRTTWSTGLQPADEGDE